MNLNNVDISGLPADIRKQYRQLQNIKHEFCLTYLKMTETEYLEALNKATNGGVEAWAN